MPKQLQDQLPHMLEKGLVYLLRLLPALFTIEHIVSLRTGQPPTVDHILITYRLIVTSLGPSIRIGLQISNA